MKVTFIATVFNEEGTINDFLKSIFEQSTMPDEIIIVDGGSRDSTVAKIKNQKSKIKNHKGRFEIIIKKGNRAVGRNKAVEVARNEIIACSDAGCILDRDWLMNIVKPFSDPEVDVVSGYYKGSPKTIFEKCLVTYILVMPDKVDESNFLPATRSMSFTKEIWKKVKGFPEEFNNNEDYVFAKRLKDINANIVFEKEAIVCWKPRKNLKDAFIMFYRFAKGDAESKIFRPKVILIFVRYVSFLILLSLFFLFRSYFILNTLYLMLFLYILWSIFKNYKYVRDIRAIFALPFIQILSDIAVIFGTINGTLTKKTRTLIEGLFYVSLVYSAIFFSFRQLRTLFSPSKITEDEIVGYAQYFGYPLYFETIIFFIFILSPIVVFFTLSKFRK